MRLKAVADTEVAYGAKECTFLRAWRSHTTTLPSPPAVATVSCTGCTARLFTGYNKSELHTYEDHHPFFANQCTHCAQQPLTYFATWTQEILRSPAHRAYTVELPRILGSYSQCQERLDGTDAKGGAKPLVLNWPITSCSFSQHRHLSLGI